MRMKALSVRNPWAWLMFYLQDPKDIENRSWYTKHRGPLLIHAGSRNDRLATPRYIQERFKIVLPASMECGGIIGMVNLVDVVPDVIKRTPANSIQAGSKWYDGPEVNSKPNFGFVFRDPVKLPFHYVPGSLGLFEVDYPYSAAYLLATKGSD